MPKAQLLQTFKLNGFNLRHDAASQLATLLAPLSASEASEWTDKIIEALLKRTDLKSPVISKDILVAAVKECSKEESGDVKDIIFNVINAFDVPRFTYCEERKKFLPDVDLDKRSKANIYAGADRKADLFKMRYQMLHQRTSRHELFTSSEIASARTQKKYTLRSIEHLLATTAKQNDLIILGMLTQNEHGKYSLEDPTGTVDLDLSETKFHTGLYTENCFVLVEGWYEDKVFHVTAMGFPPSEKAETTRLYFGKINFFGGPLETCAKANSKLADIEREQEWKKRSFYMLDAMFVFLSDVWLDKSNVMSKLESLLDGFAGMPPTCFVFMGNFLSTPYGNEETKILKNHLKTLGEKIAEHPRLLQHSQFIFIPGPTDPGFASIFPRPPLPENVTENLRKLVPNAHFATNPCRIQYCTQEIVLFREDIVTKMCRNCIYFPETGDIPSHFAKTLACQAHLTPLPLHTCPVYWDFDRSMYLYPLPDLVVVADKFSPFVSEVMGCKIVNPGSFSKTDFSFKTYVPVTKEVEDSQVPDE